MIRAIHVSKSFGVVRALDDVCLHVAAGERVGFVGSNGSGKTTLLRAILGLVRVEGMVTVGGVDVAKDPELALRSMAYIPQVAPPIEAPVREVVRAIAALRRIDVGRIRMRAERLGLELDAAIGTRFRDLSGGMKQKLLAAIALASETQVLVCDEPTANLDRAARNAFFEQAGERRKDAVTILCSHRVEEIERLVDRVIEMDSGRIARDEPAFSFIGPAAGELGRPHETHTPLRLIR
jgi:ABC-2 type transport system ATP-binding protein